MNHVTLLGRLGKDPETRTTQTGKTVVTASLVTNRRYLDAGGNRVEQNDWHQLTIWGKTGEAFAAHNQKGDQVLVAGEIRYESYQDRDGNTRYATKIHVNSFDYGARKREDASSSASPADLARSIADADRANSINQPGPLPF